MPNWCKQHLNWTWAGVALLRFAVIFLPGLAGTILYLVMYVLLIALTLWILNLKGRSYAWIFIPVAVLLLNNKKEVLNVKT